MEETDLTTLKIEPPTEEDSPVANVEIKQEGEDIPEMSDVGWSDYVLRQLEDDEVYDGNPTTDGLRRIARKILGKVIYSAPDVVQAPNIMNDYHAVVKWVIKIQDWEDDIIEFGDCSDFGRYNAPVPKEGERAIDYARWASATAATKAEGRALRKALNLKRVIAAEEASSNTESYLPSKITPGQINFIDMMCQRNNINVLKLIGLSKKSNYKRVEDMPYGAAIQMNKYLSGGQNGGKTKFPESILGYDSNWRNNAES